MRTGARDLQSEGNVGGKKHGTIKNKGEKQTTTYIVYTV
jgi:hypothetical protein